MTGYDVAAYRRLVDHGQSCPRCVHGICPVARRLWRLVRGREDA
ncbi:hypothetical protein [Streptomyces sp. NPDC001221]